MDMQAWALPSAAALSFLGDAVHTLAVRRRLVLLGFSHAGKLNEEARRLVSAEAQAEQARRLLPRLREAEADVYRRAFNSCHLNRPRHASGADYRAATGLEAVFGMLEYTGQRERLDELIACAIGEEGESHDTEN